MRHYQCDSPEAAARIVAACLLSDGHIGNEELDVLDRHGIEQRLSLRPHQFLAVVQTLCEDLTSAAYLNWGDACRLDSAVVTQLAADVQDPQMQRDIIWLCKEAIHADKHISEGEARFLRQLRAAWELPEHVDWVRPREVIRLARVHRK
ncbi:TerB family tellurite resistance protein [Caballeronia sp. 15711]|uniref:TerB family tellurite resistance protein n=1 Tax=Caballeronia sp. 15711 TaxID=3391029 RepID=UPI0039E65145